jgi:hypothetical protein
MYKMSDTVTESDSQKNRQNILYNIRTLIFYALSLTVALGFNDLFVTIFSSFPRTQHIIAKTTYVVVMFGLTLLAATVFSSTITTRGNPAVS